ncbi:glycine/betaine/sarcosine/D-proline family reductase selenoprotein B, partial [Pseudomonas aeruginosa]|nr:glycine/betaine/sarcosine/D-proline family reductase selenoprotein B [Pseudomonas aeruginosa]
MAEGKEIGLPDEEGYFPRGIRRPCWRDKSGAERAVDMAVAKALGQPYTTEVGMPKFDHIVPSAPVAGLSKAKVAILTSGGMV